MGNGTTQAELLLFQTIAPLSVLLRNVAVTWIFYMFQCALRHGIWLSFVLDLLFIVVPVILTLTLLSDHMLLILFVQTAILLTITLISFGAHYLMERKKLTYCQVFDQINDDHYSPTKFVTYMRFYGFVATACAILSVDFSVFPHRFAKTSMYGRSVMDLGTATFVYCFAVVDVFRDFPGRITNSNSLQKSIFRFKPSSSVVLIFLGIARTVLLHQLHYSYSIYEYGVHWNFFITLGVLRLIVDLLGRRYHLFLGVIIACIYQYFLTEQKLEKYLLLETTKRNNIVSKNREGIFSLFGYLSIYYLASALSRFLFSRISPHSYHSTQFNLTAEEKRKKLGIWFHQFIQLLLLVGILFALQKTSEMIVGPPSRRIANVPYVLEMLVFNTIYMCGYLFIQLLQSWSAQTSAFRKSLNNRTSDMCGSGTIILIENNKNSFAILKPCLVDSINRNGLTFFLLANILTGLINKSIKTSSVSNHYHSTAIITVYMFVSITTVHLCNRLRKS